MARGVANMSLINLPEFELPEPSDPPTPDPARAADPAGAPSGESAPAAVYTLVYDDPDQPAAGNGMGWSLIARYDEGTTWSWQASLSARGAGAHAPARVAQAVAVRVLSEHDIAVGGWTDTSADQPGGMAGFRARLVPRPRAAPPTSASWRPRRAVSRHLQGH
jgi:hypothetical protein